MQIFQLRSCVFRHNQWLPYQYRTKSTDYSVLFALYLIVHHKTENCCCQEQAADHHKGGNHALFLLAFFPSFHHEIAKALMLATALEHTDKGSSSISKGVEGSLAGNQGQNTHAEQNHTGDGEGIRPNPPKILRRCQGCRTILAV